VEAKKFNDRPYTLFLWLIFVTLAAGIILTGTFNYRDKSSHYKKEMEHKLAAIADLKAGEILHWKTERLRDAQVFFRSSVFTDLLREYFIRPQDRLLKEKLLDWLTRVQKEYDYDRVDVTDDRGRLRLSLPGGWRNSLRS
jgi:hypothetical protein